jgi:hypothetical protein
MKMRIVLPAAAAVTITAFAVISFARGAEAIVGDIAIVKAWARATPPGARVGAAYVAIENRGAADDSLVGAASPAAHSVMLHETVEENGIAKMRPLDIVNVPADSMVEMQPGGMHMMLMGLSAPLKEGESVPLTLTFERAGTVTVDAGIAPIGAGGPMEMRHQN